MMKQYIKYCIRQARKMLLAKDYEYSYDPKHEKKPDGGGWEKTENGWSKNISEKKQDSSIDRKNPTVPKEFQTGAFKDFETNRDPKYKFHIFFSKEKMKDIFDNGHFSVISSGKNSEIEGDDLPDEYFVKRHEQLKNDLEAMKIPFTECMGKYKGGSENSIIIPHDYFILETKDKNFMVHHKDGTKEEYDAIDKLGEKYNQQSVLHGNKSRFDMHFTTGSKKGKICGGNGWREIEPSEEDEYHTEIELTKQQISKVTMDIHECFEKGYL